MSLRQVGRILPIVLAGGLLAGGLAPLTLAAHKRPRHRHAIFGNVKSKRHHTVVAVAGDGAAATVRASPFKLVPTARRFRLEIRGPDGSYQGPVVAARTGKRVVVGFRAGAKLGPIVQRNGYWVLKRSLPKRFQDRTSTARALKGVPVGARNLGLVRATAAGRAGRGQDQDRDGIPGVFDIDADGDRVLNNVDPDQPASPYRVTWLLSVGLKQSFLAEQMGLAQGVAGYALNQNAVSSAITTQQLETLRDLAAKIRGMLVFTLPRDDTLELDCGGLSYCSGTFTSTGTDITQFRRFPRDFDPDGDGFGTMEPTALPLNPQRDGIGVSERLSPNAKVFVLKPTADHFGDVAAGDTYIERSRNAQQPVMLNYTFGTVPALAAWSDGSQQTSVTYPVPANGPGTSQTPYRSRQYPNGTLTFTVWRPQRRSFPTAGETGDWTDVGHLLYSAAGFLEGSGGDRVWTCPNSAYTSQDPNMQLEPDGLRDRRGDGPVDRNQTLTFSVDIGACLRHSGLDPATVTASSAIYVTASSDLGDAAEGVGFSFSGVPPGPPPPPPSTGAFTGTWRFGPGATGLDWSVSANQFATDQFGIKVYPPVGLTGGTSPPGWTCAVRNLTAVNDMWFCTGSSFSAGTTLTGSVTLSQPGSNGMPVEAIAPAQAGDPRDTGYQLAQTQ